jgi:hypothetical protein
VARIIAEISSSDALASVTEALCSLVLAASERLALESWPALEAV